MTKIKITIAKSAGFCFGVKRALEIAEEAAQKEKNVYMLGDIVHNETVVRKITAIGIKKIDRLKKNSHNKTLLIRAHGAPESVYKKAKQFNYKIIDATCPMVTEIHKIAKMQEKKGCQIIIIGDKKHDEVQGILGQLKDKAIVVDSAKSIEEEKIKKIKEAAVVIQSTQNLEKVDKVMGLLKKYIANISFFNTICNPTRQKQKEIKTLAGENDLVIVIGSKTSANTKRLYQIAHRKNPNSYWINSQKSIKKDWFKNVRTVAISAGASTPPQTIKGIADYIRTIDKKLL
jgi:4-hydroxy-3-methylbut-2-enyl diphosphate reductase